MGVNFMAMILLNLDYWLVGRYLGAEALGVYTLAYRLPELLILQFARIISQVIFPIYTKMRGAEGGLARGFDKVTVYVSLFTIPLGVGLALLALPFTLVFLSEKWLDAVPVMQMIALYAMFLSLIHNASSAYRALGDFRALNWLGIIRLTLLFPALWWATSIQASIVVVAQMHVLVAFIGAMLGLIVAIRLLGLRGLDLLSALFPIILAGSIMAGVIVTVLNLMASFSAGLQLIVLVPLGVLTYGAVLWLVNREIIIELAQKLRSAIPSRRTRTV
jgi:PST family polysaccharide transporter